MLQIWWRLFCWESRTLNESSVEIDLGGEGAVILECQSLLKTMHHTRPTHLMATKLLLPTERMGATVSGDEKSVPCVAARVDWIHTVKEPAPDVSVAWVQCTHN